MSGNATLRPASKAASKPSRKTAVSVRFAAEDGAAYDWLRGQEDPHAALLHLIRRELAGGAAAADEIAGLRHQVRVLLDVLDRITAAHLAPPQAPAATLPASLTGPLVVPPYGLTAAAPAEQQVAAASHAAAGQRAVLQPAGAEATIDQKLSKILDFGDLG